MSSMGAGVRKSITTAAIAGALLLLAVASFGAVLPRISGEWKIAPGHAIACPVVPIDAPPAEGPLASKIVAVEAVVPATVASSSGLPESAAQPLTEWWSPLNGRPSTGRKFSFSAPEGIYQVESSQPVELALAAGQDVTWWAIRGVPEGWYQTELTISGLHPNLYYRLLQDGIDKGLMASDWKGSISFLQDVSSPHAGELHPASPLPIPEVVSTESIPDPTETTAEPTPSDTGTPSETATPTPTTTYLTGNYTFTGNVTDQNIVVNANGITINGGGFTLSGSLGGGRTGITVGAYRNITITNMVIDDFLRGVLLGTSNNVTLRDVTIQNCDYGVVDSYGSNGVVLRDSTLSSNGRGMQLVWTTNVVMGTDAASKTELHPCIFSDNGLGFEYYGSTVANAFVRNCDFYGQGAPFLAAADTALAYAGININTSNRSGTTAVNLKPIFFITGNTGSTYNSINNDTNFMYLGGCNGSKVENLDMGSSGQYIWVDRCTNVDVTSCDLTGTFGGVIVTQSTGTDIIGCTISNYRWTGILVGGTGAGGTGGTIQNCTINSVTSGVGIAVLNSTAGLPADSISISGNIITNTPNWGLYLLNSAGNAISGNTIQSTYGVSITGSSINNVISTNHFTTNTLYGLYTTAAGNQIFNNDFSGNATQAWDSGGSDWSKGYVLGAGGCGNHWTEWVGDDKCSGAGIPQTGGAADGIVDAPRVIAGGAGVQDNYPWLEEGGWFLVVDETPIDEGS